MTAEQTAAFVNAASSRAVIRAMAMQAANYERVSKGEALAYSEDAIANLIEDEGIGHNSVVTMLNQCL